MAFSVERGKTGEAAFGILSPRARRLVEAYIATLPFELHEDAPYSGAGTISQARRMDGCSRQDPIPRIRWSMNFPTCAGACSVRTKSGA